MREANQNQFAEKSNRFWNAVTRTFHSSNEHRRSDASFISPIQTLSGFHENNKTHVYNSISSLICAQHIDATLVTWIGLTLLWAQINRGMRNRMNSYIYIWFYEFMAFIYFRWIWIVAATSNSVKLNCDGKSLLVSKAKQVVQEMNI